VAVAQEEIGGVDQDAAIALGGDREAPEDGLRERVLHRAAFGGLGLEERKFSLPCTMRTRGPTRSKETILPPPSCPRSRPTSLEPSPAARPVA